MTPHFTVNLTHKKTCPHCPSDSGGMDHSTPDENNDSDKKYVLVPGGLGYVGSHTVVELLNTGDYVPVVVDNLYNSSEECVARLEKLTGKPVPFYNIDLTHDPKTSGLEDIFRQYRFHSVINFAGLKAVGESVQIPLTYYKTNLGITFNLLDTMKKFGVKNFVFSSSACVYGNPQKNVVDESHPVGQCLTNTYGRTKYFIEVVLQDLAAAEDGWNIILLRYFNPVGAHESGEIGEDPKGTPNNLMPYVSQVAVGVRPQLSVYGDDYDTPDGTGVRDYIHVVDLAQGHVATLRKIDDRCGFKVYNLGTGRGHSVLEVIKAYQKASGRNISYEIVGRREGDVPSLCADPSLAEQELGWKATRGLDEMCASAWNWQRKNPQGYSKAGEVNDENGTIQEPPRKKSKC